MNNDQSKVRAVQRVELKSAPDLAIFVGALSALEAIELSTQLSSLEKTQDLVAAQLAAYVCNEDGSRRLADVAEAVEFLRSIRPGQMKKILAAGRTLNELNDEAIEAERKN